MNRPEPHLDIPGDPRDAILDHLPALRAFARSLTGDRTAADDLVQEAVLKAWTKFDLYRPGTNLRAWLFTIQRNLFYSDRRRAGREIGDADGSFTESLASKPDHDGRLALADFARAFARLPSEQREALVLVGAMGFSVDEAAETCACAPGTIKSRANRARRALADALQLTDDDALDLTEGATRAVMSAQRPAGA
ncbi:MAG: sigma-70 family RNA polymerase sigma factor [Alkalilacustris sp.]